MEVFGCVVYRGKRKDSGLLGGRVVAMRVSSFAVSCQRRLRTAAWVTSARLLEAFT